MNTDETAVIEDKDELKEISQPSQENLDINRNISRKAKPTFQFSHSLVEVCNFAAPMPASRGSRLCRKGCSLARRTQQQATAAWRRLCRLLFMVSRGFGEDVNVWS